MKKMLVLLAILALVPMASAGVIIKDAAGVTVGDSYTASVGDTVTFTFYQTAGNIDGVGGEIYVSVAGNNKVIEDLTPTPVYDVTTGLYGWAWANNFGVSVTGAGDFLCQKVANFGAVGTPGEGSFMNQIPAGFPADYVGTFSFSFEVTAETTGVAFSGEWDGVDTAGLSFAIPEPISVALLGLGGLFIRRRS